MTTQAALRAIQARMDLLREVAADLRNRKVNAWHAANRIEKIAGEVAPARRK